MKVMLWQPAYQLKNINQMAKETSWRKIKWQSNIRRKWRRSEIALESEEAAKQSASGVILAAMKRNDAMAKKAGGIINGGHHLWREMKAKYHGNRQRRLWRNSNAGNQYEKQYGGCRRII